MHKESIPCRILPVLRNPRTPEPIHAYVPACVPTCMARKGMVGGSQKVVRLVSLSLARALSRGHLRLLCAKEMHEEKTITGNQKDMSLDFIMNHEPWAMSHEP